MTKEYTAIQTVARIERHGTSTMGNPSYKVAFTDDTVAVTTSNSGFAYGITNPEWLEAPVEVHYTAAGYIKYFRHIED